MQFPGNRYKASYANDSCRSGESENLHRSSSITKRSPSPADSRGRFNPTAYIRERNLKLRQIEIKKSREARRRRSSGQRGSNSDMSDFSIRGGIASLRLNDSDDGLHTSSFRWNSSRKQTGLFNQYKSKDSTDSDIDGVSSPPVLHKTVSTNATNIVSHKFHQHSSSDHHQQNQNPSTNINDMIDIDERLKSLEKFMKENLPS